MTALGTQHSLRPLYACMHPTNDCVPLPLSLQASRDYVRATRGVRRPEMILAKSAHAAYWKVDRGGGYYYEGQRPVFLSAPSPPT